MPTEPVQIVLTVLEISVLLAGTFLFLRLVFNLEARTRWLGVNQLPSWPVNLVDFAFLVGLVFLGGFLGKAGVQILFGGQIVHALDREGLEIFAYGAGFHGGALVGWLLFPQVCRHWHADLDVGLRPEPAPVLPWSKIARCAGGTLLVAMPLLTLLSLGWVFLLKKAGLPDEPQELIAIFANTRSPFVIIGMLLVACVVAPLNEELIFRAGLYRFCRQRLGRGWALLISGCLFGALHLNLAGFLPLAALGAGLALAYEATGSIRVSVVAHGLFNLNTILIVLSGLPQ